MEVCETCGHIWGAYEDDCHCREGVCHNPDVCNVRPSGDMLIDVDPGDENDAEGHGWGV